MAVKDAKRLQKYDSEKGCSMTKEATQAVQRKQKENRTLAKEISKWVGQAVQRSKMEEEDDIAVPPDDGDQDEPVGEALVEGVDAQDKDCSIM